MIVLIIIGFFVTFGARKFVNSSTEIKSSVRKFSTMAKKLRQRARIDNKTYRIVFDLPVDSKKMQSYWIESTDKQALLLSEEERDDLEEAILNNLDRPSEDKDRPPPDPQGFVTDSRIIKKSPATLPDGLVFESIELDGPEVEKFKEGRIYIYFFPQGRVQTSAIHLTNKDNLNWTIAIEGISGRVNLYPEYRGLEDILEKD